MKPYQRISNHLVKMFSFRKPFIFYVPVCKGLIYHISLQGAYQICPHCYHSFLFPLSYT